MSYFHQDLKLKIKLFDEMYQSKVDLRLKSPKLDEIWLQDHLVNNLHDGIFEELPQQFL